MYSKTIDTFNSIGTVFLFAGGGIAISLQEIESYLRILTLLVGLAVTLFVFWKNHIKKDNNDNNDKSISKG